MTKLFPAALILLSITVQAQQQNSFLEPDNPEPRLGASVDISINLQKEDIQWLTQKPNKTSDDFDRLRENTVARGTLKITHQMIDTGLVTLGPFTFVIDGISYQTNALTPKVQPPLPGNITDGLWIRVVDFGNESFLLIEQRVANSWRRDNKDPNTITIGTSDLKFAEFNRDRLEQSGIEILSSSESTENQTLENEGSSGVVNAGYKLLKFKFRKTSSFRAPVKIDRSFFSEVGKNIKVPEVIIK